MPKEEITEVIHVLTLDQMDDLVTQAGEYLLKNAYVGFRKRTVVIVGLGCATSYYLGARAYRSYVLWKIKNGDLLVKVKPGV